jgi:hypothetical protein
MWVSMMGIAEVDRVEPDPAWDGDALDVEFLATVAAATPATPVRNARRLGMRGA